MPCIPTCQTLIFSFEIKEDKAEKILYLIFFDLFS